MAMLNNQMVSFLFPFLFQFRPFAWSVPPARLSWHWPHEWGSCWWHGPNGPVGVRTNLPWQPRDWSAINRYYYPLVNKHSYWTWPIYSGFTYKKMWFSIDMLVYQRVNVLKKWMFIPQNDGITVIFLWMMCRSTVKPPLIHPAKMESCPYS